MAQYHIGCTRFTNETYQQNKDYMQKKQLTGCIYGTPRRIPATVPINSSAIIFEMNNDQNKLIGIGIVKNWIDTSTRRKIYTEGNYNRYIYRGEYHLSRDEMLKYGEDKIQFLETMMFKGRTNFKRGDSITCMSQKYQHIFNRQFEKNIKDYCATMFQEKYGIK